MNLLTPTGYKNIDDVNIGDELIAYDINTGVIIINTLLKKELWTNDMLPSIPPVYQSIQNEETLEYEEVLEYEGMPSEEVFQETYGDWKFYEINGTWKLFVNQSIWVNMKVVHVSDLQIGDIIYDDEDNDVIVTSIVECVEPSWWRLTLSGDKSYIADGIQLHNPSRFWSGNMTPTSFNWNFTTGGTNWGSASGVADNATVPTSVDDVIFDGAGTKGNANNTLSANITILSITFTSGYTATATINSSITLTVAGNFTDNLAHTWVVGSVTTSILAISAASTINSGGQTFPSRVFFLNANTKTLAVDWTILGQLVTNTTNALTVLNQTGTNTLFCNGYGQSYNSGISGTAGMRTSGTVDTSGSGGNNYIQLRTLEFAGNLSVLGPCFFQNIILKYISGTVTHTGTLTLYGGNTFDTFPIVWNNIGWNTTGNITINSLLQVAGFFSIPGSSNTFLGTAGFTVGTLANSSGGAQTYTFTVGNTYTINNALTIYNTSSTTIVTSSHAVNRATLILTNGATCTVRANFTRINATGGRTINTWNSTVTDCLNVRNFTDFQGVSNTIIN
jgi:hypothetical protein